jgi:hypothetical protein
MPTLNETFGVVAEVDLNDESNFEYESEDLSAFDEFNPEPEHEDKYSHLPLLNKVNKESLNEGFGAFIDKLAQKVGEDTPVRIGETYSNLIIIPRAIRTLGNHIQPKDTFGLRLFGLLELLTVEHELRDENFRKRLIWEVNRAKGALIAFGRTSIAKKLSQSGRAPAFLVNRACDSIDPNEVLIRPEDAERLFLEEGCLVLVGRYPGSSFSCHKVVFNPRVPEGTIYTPTKALLSHQGDVDGDTVLVLKIARPGNQKDLTEKIRQVNDFLNSMAIGPDVNNQFGGVSNNNVREWLKPVKFKQKFQFRGALEMTLKEYKNHVSNNIANVVAVGLAYEVMFVAFCLATAGRPEYRAAYTLAASIYENVFLAGFKPERLPMLLLVSRLEVLNYNNKDLTAMQLVQYFTDIAYDLGFDFSDNNFGLTNYQLAYQYLQCCALSLIRRTRANNPEAVLAPVVEELAQPIIDYLPLVDLVRKISRGSPDWDTNTPVEVINMMVTNPEAHELFQNSTLRKFLNTVYPTYTRLCKLTNLSLRVKASATEDEV